MPQLDDVGVSPPHMWFSLEKMEPGQHPSCGTNSWTQDRMWELPATP